LIILIIFGEDKLWSSSLCNFLQLPITSSPYGPNSLLKYLSIYSIYFCCSRLEHRAYVKRSV
jgi:hypothetical protein